MDAILKRNFSIVYYWLVSSNLVIMSSDEWHGTLLKISQYWLRWWLGTIGQQAITWTNVCPDVWRHMTSLNQNTTRLYTQGIRSWSKDNVVMNGITGSKIWLIWVIRIQKKLAWRFHAISWHVIPLWLTDTIWRHRFGSTVAQIMVCCLTAPSYHLNQQWLLISEQWCSIYIREIWREMRKIFICYMRFGTNGLKNMCDHRCTYSVPV